MSEGLHHFKFLYQRFLASTLGWPEDAQMGYIKLLIVQFERGSIPKDLKGIGAISPAAKKHWKRIGPKFKGVREDGSLYNKVMDGVRNEAMGAYASSVENGKKGGRPKKTHKKPAGSENNNPEETGGFPIDNPPGNPSTNHKPETSTVTLKEGESVITHANLSESNLFRKPNVPDLETVRRVFAQQGGSTEMAQKFFESNEAVGWFYKGNPIMNFSNLVPGYVANWTRNETKTSVQQKANGGSVADAIAAARAKNNA